MGKYFGTDGFRGEANKVLTADHAYKIDVTWAGITTRITGDGSLSERIRVAAVICLSMRWLPVLRHPEQMHSCCMLPLRQVWHM